MARVIHVLANITGELEWVIILYLASIIKAVTHKVRQIREDDMKSSATFPDTIILEYWCRNDRGIRLITNKEAIIKCQYRLLTTGSTRVIISVKVRLSIYSG